MEDDMKPTDPVTENQNVLMGKPVKAFLYQDHVAHITVHTAAMKDPRIGQLLQNNPMAQAMQQAMMAHINEHLGFEYRRQIEQQLGMPLPPQKDESGEEMHMNPEIEARLSPLLAQAAQQLLQNNQQQVAQQQAQQQAQDPLIQMQQQELQLKAQEVMLKQQKQQIDAAAKADQLDIERERIAKQQETEFKRISVDALKVAAQMEEDREKQTMDRRADILKNLRINNERT